jgi:hypothetical protein
MPTHDAPEWHEGNGRHGIYIDLNPEYVAMARKRIVGDCPMFTEIGT